MSLAEILKKLGRQFKVREGKSPDDFQVALAKIARDSDGWLGGSLTSTPTFPLMLRI